MYHALDLLHSVTMTSGASIDVIGAFFMIVLPPRSVVNFTSLFDRSEWYLDVNDRYNAER